MSTTLCPFHLAIPVNDLDAARRFYCDRLGCGTGRSAPRWLDLDFFGHQVTLHVVDGYNGGVDTNAVDGDNVPARHFGVVLPMEEWKALRRRFEEAGGEFLISPKIRFEGEVGEQATLFIVDPAGNAIEFKSFADPARLFAH